MTCRSFFSALLNSDDRGMELHLVLGAVAILIGLGLTVWTVIVQDKPFDIVSFGQGIGYLFTGAGIAAVAQGLQRKAQGAPPP